MTSLLIPQVGYKYKIDPVFLKRNTKLVNCGDYPFTCMQIEGKSQTRIDDVMITHPRYYFVCEQHQIATEISPRFILEEMKHES